jgi:thiol-disulfide isomerase/thioredoxin
LKTLRSQSLEIAPILPHAIPFILFLKGDGLSLVRTSFALKNQLSLDLWTTKCVKCPAALEKLNRLALEFPDVLFVACVLNDKEMAEEIIEENEWGNMTHVFVESAIKESLKAQFSFSEVPFCLVIDSVGSCLLPPSSPYSQAHIVQAFGNPKNLNLPEILKVGSETGGVAETSANSLTTNVFSSDDF